MNFIFCVYRRVNGKRGHFLSKKPGFMGYFEDF
jgi:hypothetical protein